jgi:hypothetical protein
VVVPYNVRLTQSLLDLFGEKVAWLSKHETVFNTSSSYGTHWSSQLSLKLMVSRSHTQILPTKIEIKLIKGLMQAHGSFFFR